MSRWKRNEAKFKKYIRDSRRNSAVFIFFEKISFFCVLLMSFGVYNVYNDYYIIAEGIILRGSDIP